MRRANPDADVRRGHIIFEHESNNMLCQRCTERYGQQYWFFSTHYAKTGQPPLQCPNCKRTDWWKKKVRRGQKGG